jgi:hypothetical protein
LCVRTKGRATLWLVDQRLAEAARLLFRLAAKVRRRASKAEVLMSADKARGETFFDVGSRKTSLPVMMQPSGSNYLSLASEGE